MGNKTVEENKLGECPTKKPTDLFGSSVETLAFING